MINHPNRSKARRRITMDISRSEFAELQAGLARLTVSVHATGPAHRMARIRALGQKLAATWDAGQPLELT